MNRMLKKEIASNTIMFVALPASILVYSVIMQQGDTVSPALLGANRKGRCQHNRKDQHQRQDLFHTGNLSKGGILQKMIYSLYAVGNTCQTDRSTHHAPRHTPPGAK